MAAKAAEWPKSGLRSERMRLNACRRAGLQSVCQVFFDQVHEERTTPCAVRRHELLQGRWLTALPGLRKLSDDEAKMAPPSLGVALRRHLFENQGCTFPHFAIYTVFPPSSCARIWLSDISYRLRAAVNIRSY